MSRPVVKTLADLKRIPVGTKLRLVASLMGPTPVERQLRTVDRVTPTQMMLRIEEGPKAGLVSYLHFPPASRFCANADGFTVFEVDDRDGSLEVAAQYVFVDPRTEDIEQAHRDATMEAWARAMTPKPIELEHGTLYPIASKPCGRCGQGEAAGAAGLCRVCVDEDCARCNELADDAATMERAKRHVSESVSAAMDQARADWTDGTVCPTCHETMEDEHGDCEAEAAERERIVYAVRCIQGPDAGCFWSNAQGWQEYGGEDFTPAERATFSLPIGGEWVCGKCGQGDPASAGHVCR